MIRPLSILFLTCTLSKRVSGNEGKRDHFYSSCAKQRDEMGFISGEIHTLESSKWKLLLCTQLFLNNLDLFTSINDY